MKQPAITFVETKRIVKMFQDEKHIKSFPLSIKNSVYSITQEMIIQFTNKKTLSDSECVLISEVVFPIILNEFLRELEQKEIYVFELTKNQIFDGIIRVKTKSNTRHELTYKNNLRIKCPELLYKFSTKKLPSIYSNY